MSKKKTTEESLEKETVETGDEVTEEPLKEDSEKTENIQEEQNDWQDRYLRLFAEFDNYKKRTQKETLATYGNGVSDTCEKLLAVIDNFERAIAAIEENDSSPLAEGVKMIYKQFKETFESIGITEIPALGEKFDPNLHNAVMHTDDENYGESEIVEVFMKGYKYKDSKVLRHSMVKVAN